MTLLLLYLISLLEVSPNQHWVKSPDWSSLPVSQHKPNCYWPSKDLLNSALSVEWKPQQLWWKLENQHFLIPMAIYFLKQFNLVIDLSFENPIHQMDIRGIFLEWEYSSSENIARRLLLEDNWSKTIGCMTKLVHFFILHSYIFRTHIHDLKKAHRTKTNSHPLEQVK